MGATTDDFVSNKAAVNISWENEYAADMSSIKQAQERIRPYVTKTPVLSAQTLNSLAGRNLHFKCECLQKWYLYSSYIYIYL